MTTLKAGAFLAVLLASSTLAACAGGAGRDEPSGPPPQTAFQSTPEQTLAIEARKVTTIRSKTVGVIANEPKHIIAAVVGISSDGRTTLSGNADKEPYRVVDVRDGEDFEIDGIPFRIETFPQRGEVTVYQLADDDR